MLRVFRNAANRLIHLRIGDILELAYARGQLAAKQGLRFLGYLAYALTMALTILTIILLSLLLLRRRPRRQPAVS